VTKVCEGVGSFFLPQEKRKPSNTIDKMVASFINGSKKLGLEFHQVKSIKSRACPS
jgi:hypothetical protein